MFVCDIPPIVYTLVLLDAFIRIKQCDGVSYSLSTKQILIQFVATLACTIVDVVPNLPKTEVATLDLGTFSICVNLIGLFVLTITLMLLADLSI